MGLTNPQAVRWIEGLREDLAGQRKRPRLAPAKRLAFLSEQYERLFLLNRALSGGVTFIGAPPIGEEAEP